MYLEAIKGGKARNSRKIFNIYTCVCVYTHIHTHTHMCTTHIFYSNYAYKVNVMYNKYLKSIG